MTDFYNIFTISGLIALTNIIIIDLIMSGDNAIVIGMATKNLPKELRKKAINIGIILATVLRIILAFFAVALMEVVGIKLIGGLLLLYVVWKFYKEMRVDEKAEKHLNLKSGGSLFTALHTIIIADVSMSLDNVLAVSGASKVQNAGVSDHNMAVLAIGLVFSIILMAFASNYIAKKLDNYPQIQWLGLFVILFVAMGMIADGSHEVANFNILPFIIFLLGSFFVFLHKKYLEPFEEYKLKAFVDKNYLKILLAFFSLILMFLFLGNQITDYLNKNVELLYSLGLICFFAITELFIYITENKKK